LNADAETSAFFFASLYNESLFLQWLSLNCGSFQTVTLFKLWLSLNCDPLQKF